MNSLNIFKYEFTRIVLTKKYLYILLIISLFTYDVLTRLLIDGVGGTAPFSTLSFSYFAGVLNPMLLSILVFLCISIFSEKEEAAKKIIFSTSFSKARYYLIRCSAVGASFLLTAAVPVIFSFAYYGYLFSYYHYGDFLFPIVLLMAPPFVFVLGLAMAAGRRNVRMLYGLIPVLFFGGMFNIGLPVWLDICSNNFLTSYSYKIAEVIRSGEASFYFPQEYILSRIVFVAAGILLMALACRKK